MPKAAQKLPSTIETGLYVACHVFIFSPKAGATTVIILHKYLIL